MSLIIEIVHLHLIVLLDAIRRCTCLVQTYIIMWCKHMLLRARHTHQTKKIIVITIIIIINKLYYSVKSSSKATQSSLIGVTVHNTSISLLVGSFKTPDRILRD